jgi:hypothetical protein
MHVFVSGKRPQTNPKCVNIPKFGKYPKYSKRKNMIFLLWKSDIQFGDYEVSQCAVT